MTEYAFHRGQRIEIRTPEVMHCLSADQAGLVHPDPDSLVDQARDAARLLQVPVARGRRHRPRLVRQPAPAITLNDVRWPRRHCRRNKGRDAARTLWHQRRDHGSWCRFCAATAAASCTTRLTWRQSGQ